MMALMREDASGVGSGNSWGAALLLLAVGAALSLPDAAVRLPELDPALHPAVEPTSRAGLDRTFAILQFTMLGVGTAGVIVLLMRGRPRIDRLVPWKAKDGWMVCALLVAPFWAAPFIGGALYELAPVASLAGNLLPWLIGAALVHRYLVRPFGSLGSVFRIGPCGPLAILGGGLFLAGADMVASRFLFLNIGDDPGSYSHFWSWFWAQIRGDPGSMAVAIVFATAGAAFFEELLFRGVLYGTLRRHAAAAPAALLSAAVFALIHGYGMAGYLGLVVFGVLAAVVYEFTGSLAPGMAGHAIVNACGTGYTIEWWG